MLSMIFNVFGNLDVCKENNITVKIKDFYLIIWFRSILRCVHFLLLDVFYGINEYLL